MESLLIVGFIVAVGVDRQDQLFASWQEAQGSVKSLVVQFTLETTDRVFAERRKAEGTFRLIRTPKGEVYAFYEITQANSKGAKQERWSGLLNNGRVYLLHHDKKRAIPFEPTELRCFLEQYFNPFVLLLDQKRAREKCQVQVIKQDEWYTYLSVKPKQVQRFQEGRAVLMNKDSDAVPKNMPRQLWYTDGGCEYTFDIKAWRLKIHALLWFTNLFD
jgi:hypothetical protein